VLWVVYSQRRTPSTLRNAEVHLHLSVGVLCVHIIHLSLVHLVHTEQFGLCQQCLLYLILTVASTMVGGGGAIKFYSPNTTCTRVCNMILLLLLLLLIVTLSKYVRVEIYIYITTTHRAIQLASSPTHIRASEQRVPILD
jgi:hypothetical protein